MTDITFNSEDFFRKFRKLSEALEADDYEVDTAICALGKIKEEYPQEKC